MSFFSFVLAELDIKIALSRKVISTIEGGKYRPSMAGDMTDGTAYGCTPC